MNTTDEKRAIAAHKLNSNNELMSLVRSVGIPMYCTNSGDIFAWYESDKGAVYYQLKANQSQLTLTDKNSESMNMHMSLLCSLATPDLDFIFDHDWKEEAQS